MVALSGGLAQAQIPYSWAGGGADNNWATQGNWTGAGLGGFPNSDVNNTWLQFTGTAQTNNNNNITNYAVNRISFTNTSGVFGSFTLNGNALTLGTGGLQVDAGNTLAQTVNLGITLSGAQTWTHSGTGLLTVNGAVTTGGTAFNLAGTGNVTFQTGTLSLGAGGLTSTNTGTVNLNKPITLTANAAITNNAASGTFTVGGNVTTGGFTLTAGGSGTSTYTGVISGTGGLTKSGAGTVILRGANTYSGLTTISAGTLQVGNNTTTGTLGTGAVVNNAALVFFRSDNATAANDISGSGTLTKLGGGVLSLTGTNTYAGTTTVTTGTLQVGNGGTTGTLGTGGVTNNATLAFNRTDAISVGNLISGTGGVTQAGTGTTTLTAANTYTGVTAVTAGVLNATTLTDGGTASNIGAATNDAANIVLNGGTLRYSGGAVTIDRLFSVGAGGGAFDASGSGALTLGNTGSIGFAGAGARTVTLTGTSTDANTLAAFVGNNGAAATGLTKTGTGTWVLTGSNAYTGVTAVNGGTLSVGSLTDGGAASNIGAASNAAGNLILNGGTLLYTGATTTSDRLFTVGVNGGTIDASGSGYLLLTNTGAVGLTGTNTARTLSLTGSNAGQNTLAAALGDNGSGATSLVKGGTGTWYLTGGNTYSGGTTITAGSLVLGDGGSTGTLGTGTVTVNVANGLILNRGDNYTLPNVFAGSGEVVKALAGTATLTGNSTFSGTWTISAGTLQVGDGGTSGTLGTAAVNNAAALVFNRSDALTVDGLISGTGSVTQAGGGTTTLTAANTYTGVTAVTAGTLSVGTLADGGSASGIGAATGDAANIVLAGGTLQYTGSGSSTNRLFTLGTGTSGLDASGSGAVTFANTGSLGYAGSGDRTLTLSGTSTAANTLSAAVGDGSGGATGVTKTGPGTWVLAGTNSYSGPTAVSGGQLWVNGDNSAAAGAVTVAAGGLRGTGVVGGATTVQGGGTVAGGTAASPTGTLTLTNALTVQAGGNLGVRVTAAGDPDATATGGSSTTGVHNKLTVSGTRTFDLGMNVLIDVTGATYTANTAYSYKVVSGGAGGGNEFTISDPNRFTFTGFSGDVIGAINVTLVGTANGDVFLNFTPIPEPGTVFAIAAAALGLGAVVRRVRKRPATV